MNGEATSQNLPHAALFWRSLLLVHSLAYTREFKSQYREDISLDRSVTAAFLSIHITEIFTSL